MHRGRRGWAGWCSLLVLLWLAAPACGPEGEIRVFTDAQSGSEVALGSGEQFEIHLESNPSTGYSWEVSAMTSPGIVALDARTYVEPGSEVVGAAGTDVFVFTAASEGAGVLRLEYVRAFEDPIVPERVVELVIRIDGAPWPPSPGTPPPTTTEVAPG